MDTDLLVQVAEEFLIENLPDLPGDHIWQVTLRYDPRCRVFADSRCWGESRPLVEI